MSMDLLAYLDMPYRSILPGGGAAAPPRTPVSCLFGRARGLAGRKGRALLTRR